MTKSSTKDKSGCKRCGDCCVKIGRNFWRLGYLQPSGLEFPNKILKLLSLRTPPLSIDDEKPCDMLEFDADGKAVCLIEKHFGRDAKPEVCREYDGENRCKQNTKNRREQQAVSPD